MGTTRVGIDIRALTPEEWSLGPEPHEWPADTVVLGAFDEEERLVGRTAIVTLPHIEGAWIAEPYRGQHILIRLIHSLESLLRLLGRTHAFSFAADNSPEISGYLERLGYVRQPLSVWVKDLRE